MNIYLKLENIIFSAIQELKKENKVIKETKILLEQPPIKSQGDISTNIAFNLAKENNLKPYNLAKLIVEKIKDEEIDKIEIANGGFINFFIKHTFLYENLKEILTNYNLTSNKINKKEKILVEFVGSNPTGPLNVVSARAAAIGHTLANLLKKVGFEVSTESYINDFGTQIEKFAQSVDIRYRELFGETITFIDDGYKGDYVKDIALSLKTKVQDTYLLLEERLNLISNFAVEYIVNSQKQDLKDYGLEFDNWFSEKTLHKTGEVKEAISKLKDYTYEQESAIWFKSKLFGDDKDRVLLRSNGEPTYFLADIAYHINKFNRGFTKLVDIFGPDHQGYIPRLKGAINALGYNEDALTILVVQQVNLFEKGQELKMSKREGKFVTLKELLSEIGKDAARFFFLMRSNNAHLDFDLNLAKLHSNQNPVYYVQYANARICSILKNTKEIKIKNVNLDYLKEPEEIELLKFLLHFPELVYRSAIFCEPHRITQFLIDLVGMFHSYYNKHRIISDNINLTLARINLIKGIKIIIQTGLNLMNISIPEKM